MIYLIADTNLTHCKIGVSNTPEKRLGGIQTGNPSVLVILCVIDGSKAQEKELHQKFKDYRLNGEWFKFHENILKYFLNTKYVCDKEYQEALKSKKYKEFISGRKKKIQFLD